jgi:hypothetical protein
MEYRLDSAASSGPPGFRKNESALQHSLSVQSQAASGPSRLDAACFDRGGYIRVIVARLKSPLFTVRIRAPAAASGLNIVSIVPG